MKLNRRQTALALAASALPLSIASAQPKSPQDIPLADFFKPHRLSWATLNPSGTHVALTVGGDGKERRAVVLELATLKITPVAYVEHYDIGWARWLNDRRLVLVGHSERKDDRNQDRAPLVFAVDANGDNFKRLGVYWRRLSSERVGQSDDVITESVKDERQASFLELKRLNTRTGADVELELPAWSTDYVLDSAGLPVAVVTEKDDKARLLVREGAAGSAWRELRQWDRFGPDALKLKGRAPDGGLYVAARQGRDTLGLHLLDPQSNQFAPKPVIAVQGFDLDAALKWHNDRLVGLDLTADARTSVWFSPAHKALQDAVDQKLPATTNLLQVPERGDSPWVVVWSYSDRVVGRAYAYHRETGKLTALGASRPDLDPALMGTVDFIRYTARDGRSIPAYLTLPRGHDAKKPAPLIVWVHGGPFVRGTSWRWDAEVQFLASRGYAVLQPEFRGSDGFGQDHLQAGWQQWGLAMQNDLADGARWAIAQGYADPKRIAILGASYGGYAAMMGLVNDPDLYRCAVNMVGVTDLDLLITASWSDISPVFKRFGAARLIGDPKADAARFQATSPLRQAHRIKAPVLMAYGQYDERVPRQHGERMRDALKAHNDNVEFVLYDHEGHGWYWLETKLDFWTRVEKFLARHLA